MAIGRATAWLLRVVGSGATSLPGRLALRVEPRLVERLAGRYGRGVVVVTGTNGKTTSATALAAIAEAAGLRVVRNRSGANLAAGLATALLLDRGPGGPDALAVLEVDEATVPRMVQRLSPAVFAVSNVFRDQLDRYGELAHTVSLLADGCAALPERAALVLNADDPYVAALADKAPATVRRWYYGVDAADGRVTTAGGLGDARWCPRCGAELTYRDRVYAHLGDYVCPACGFRRPPRDVTVAGPNGVLEIRAPAMRVSRPWLLSGVYNRYNAGLAIAVAAALGVSEEAIAAGLDAVRPAFGRLEAIHWQGREVHVALVKNPTGFEQVLAVLADDARPKDVLVAINDGAADGRDVSWLWDVQLETLWPRAAARRWGVSGRRALDMAVRLKYAGVPADAITVLDEDPAVALKTWIRAGSLPLYVLPTYTALLTLRRRLERAGAVASFREG
jgi:UDP-N-acetylmuramyl tripeptide synthase